MLAYAFGVLQELLQRHTASLDPETLALDRGDGPHVPDEVGEGVELALCRSRGVSTDPGILSPGREHLVELSDGGYRRLQLVGDHRAEVGPQSVEFVQAPRTFPLGG